MGYLPFESHYDPFPRVQITDPTAQIYEKEALFQYLSTLPGTIIINTAPGVDLDPLEAALKKTFSPEEVFNIATLALDSQSYEALVEPYVTDDRVFGYKTSLEMRDLFRLDLLAHKRPPNSRVIYGFGAGLIQGDHLIHVTVKRYEHQLRMRNGMANFNVNNAKEGPLRKYKRAYFLEWVIHDAFIRSLQDQIDYLIEWNALNHPKMMAYPTFVRHLKTLSQTPFRMVPFFDAGVWGGQWLKELGNLPDDKPNYAWCFDGVVEENSVALVINEVTFDVPAQMTLNHFPKEILGDAVFHEYGYNLPIRFDLLDTMGGQNLSLQVHPTLSYIQETFGMPYTQEESYYILDAEADATVYLGFKDAIKPAEFEQALWESQTSKTFDAEKYVNVFPVKKHDHLHIPPGTIHCSGRNNLVLEISTAAYIFTFKLWDWGRLGMDGKPRPVNIAHGLRNLDYQMTESYVKSQLMNTITPLSPNTEQTGLHPSQSLNSYRITIPKEEVIEFAPTVQMANLVEGQRCEIYNPETMVKYMDIHYAETFIIPASVESLLIKAPSGPCRLMLAEMR